MIMTGVELADTCQYGKLDDDLPVSLSCDYSGFYETHHCHSRSWSRGTQDKLDAASSVAELRAIWPALEDAGEVDSHGGAEYHHALAHLRHKLAR